MLTKNANVVYLHIFHSDNIGFIYMNPHYYNFLAVRFFLFPLMYVATNRFIKMKQSL